jgi:hypothetical protein
LYQYQPVHPILYELKNLIESIRGPIEVSIQQLEKIQMKPTGMNDSLTELKIDFLKRLVKINDLKKFFFFFTSRFGSPKNVLAFLYALNTSVL